jgi:ATP-dependent exoDNAse (exonuclease V) beta subunit
MPQPRITVTGRTMPDNDHQTLLAEDTAARRRALDTGASFIVQAPAGSGKTELLVQRYLALLAQVEEPEHIVALTFTKKAAGEMRERVLQALVGARNDAPVVEEHARLTRELARAALANDSRRGWSIVEHASRLAMQTFDALAVTLARKAPLAAGLGPQPGYVEDASSLYRRAAEAALAAASADDAHWRALLAYLNNDAVGFVDLIVDMLQKRSQWLRQVRNRPLAELRAELERAVQVEIVDVLTATRNAFPQGSGARICASARDAAPVLEAIDDRREHGEALAALAKEGVLPPPTVEALPQWRTLFRFLLATNGRQLRRRFVERDGFASVGSGPGASARRERKRAIEELCRDLAAVPGLVEALAAASRLPAPEIEDASWRIVQSLVHVLDQAVGHLSLVFADEGCVDFTQAGVAAIDALGDEDAPSDLLLRLDARIQHLLVDEFQDTSYTQLRLLARLTEGWTPGDGRTIFAVGDPMQSIYRFREAEVAFFLDAQASGAIVDIPVERLQLRRNFRSQPGIVSWCNQTFAQVLGNVGDAMRGVVHFDAAVAARDDPEVAPRVDLVDDFDQEAALAVHRIREAQAAGASEIAVLVRARMHLAALLPKLRREGVPFAAVELDRLSQRQAVLDLAALTHALLQPGDRTAWIAVLRAPWCGLVLSDLLAITDAAGRDAPLLPVLTDPERIAGLSPDGRARLARTMAVFLPALDARGRAGVAERVRGAWLAVGAPACLDDPLDLDAAALYFSLVAAHEKGGDVGDWDALLADIREMLAPPAVVPPGGVQVMTIHKAKGLEFHTVIVPGLSRASGERDDDVLLRWRRRDAGLLIAPGKARGGAHEPLYGYLQDLDDEADDAELGRLLYVACTRAKTRLHLLAAPQRAVDKDTGAACWKPQKGSALAKLWPALASQARPPSSVAANAPIRRSDPPRLLRRPLDAPPLRPDRGLAVAPRFPERDPVMLPFDWARESARCIGTVAHRLLAHIADERLDRWPATRIAAQGRRVRAELASAGFAADELDDGVARVLAAVQRTLDDERGQWLFDPAHDDARSEWALSGVDDGEIVRVVLDRTFVEDGVRWIVDFKTGAHEGSDTVAFLDREVERYRGQLARYGRLVRGLDPRPVRLALYYPLIDGGFREIAAEKQL